MSAEEYKITDKNFQVTHANFAIASSGVIGKGPGNKGAVLVALRLFFDEHSRAKLEIGLGHGKKLYDKRDTIKDRDWQRDKARLMKG